jgi:hypothetical protein
LFPADDTLQLVAGDGPKRQKALFLERGIKALERESIYWLVTIYLLILLHGGRGIRGSKERDNVAGGIGPPRASKDGPRKHATCIFLRF